MLGGLLLGASATALIGWFVWTGSRDSKEPEVTPVVIKTREQWLAEVKLVKEALLAVTPKYRIYKLRDGTYAPQRSYARSENSEWYVTEFQDIPTTCYVSWDTMRKESQLDTLEEAEAWLALYIADPEITYYNGPPLEKVVDFKA